MKVADFVGNEAVHDYYGLVMVDGAPARSKTQVTITVLQRGKGWNEDTQLYEKYKETVTLQEDHSRSLKWRITHRDEFGVTDTVHINTLVIKF